MSSDNAGRPLEPFTIAVAQPVLDDLITRLRATRWALDWNNEDERYGMSTAYLRPLAEYRAGGFDWSGAEDELNRFSHPPGASAELRASVVRFMRTYASHGAVYQLEPQTLALGINDSPVGMLAWLLQPWKKWSDPKADFEKVFTPDHILTNATIYWVYHALGSSIRIYQNTNCYPWTPSRDRTPVIEAPAGFNFLLGDTYPPGVERPEERIAFFENGPTRWRYNPVYVAAHEEGGHFSPWENPPSFVDGIRIMFRGLR